MKCYLYILNTFINMMDKIIIITRIYFISVLIYFFKLLIIYTIIIIFIFTIKMAPGFIKYLIFNLELLIYFVFTM